MRRLMRRGASGLAFLLVFAGPYWLFVSRSQSHHAFVQESPKWTTLSPAERSAFRQFPAYRGAVPILTYHHISSDGDGRYLSPSTFAEQMAMLHEAGFTTISGAQFIAFLRHGASLPPKPLLLTFDDGIESLWTKADPVLKRFGMRAVAFVITSNLDRRSTYYLGREELRTAVRSGRWELGSHSSDGHRFITGSDGRTQGPFYTTRMWNGHGVEIDRAFEARVNADLSASVRDLKAFGPSLPRLFAFPFSAGSVDDREVTRRLRRAVRRNFDFSFINGASAHFIGPADAPFELMNRFLVTPQDTGESLFERLRSAVPLRPRLPNGLRHADLWVDDAGVPIAVGDTLHDGHLRLAPPTQEWREASLSPQRTVSWGDYRTRVRVDGLRADNGMEATGVLSLRRRDHPLQLSMVSVSVSASNFSVALITPTGATTHLVTGRLRQSASHELDALVVGERFTLRVDNGDEITVAVPGYRYGGVSLGAGREDDQSPQPEFSELSITPVEGGQ